MFDHSPSDKVQLRGIGDLMHPGSCAMCGSGNCQEGYIDIGVYYDYEGQVYLCMNCIRQIVDLIGALMPDQALFLKEQNQNLLKNLEAVTDERNELKSDLAEFYAVISRATSGASPDSNVEGAEQPSDNSATVTTGSENGKPVAKKSVARRRPDDAKRDAVRDESVIGI